MNKLLRYIFSLLCCLWLVSCGTDDSPTETGTVRLVFRLYVPTTTLNSRADNEETEEGQTWESAINLDQLHIVLYTKNGKSIGGLEHVALVPTTEPDTYDVTGSMLVENMNLKDGRFDGQVMVYANMTGVDEKADFTEENVHKLTYSLTSSEHYIPMWGIKQLTDISFSAGAQTQIGTINLLRAEAKMQVFLRDDMTNNYELASVTLSQANEQGYCLPQYANIKDNLVGVETLEHNAFAHFYANSTKRPLVDMTNKAIFVPEYDNSDKTTAAYINLTLRDKRNGTTEDYKIPFVEYNEDGTSKDDAPVNIVRDHYYKFTVFKEDDLLGVNLSVMKWYVVTHSDILM